MTEDDFSEFIKTEDKQLVDTYTRKLNNNWELKIWKPYFIILRTHTVVPQLPLFLRELTWEIKIEGITMPPPHEHQEMEGFN